MSIEIADIIDIQQFPWVARRVVKEKTPWGTTVVPRGWLSDGATGVPDLHPPAFLCHDCMYCTGRFQLFGEKVGKTRADIIYSWILLRDHRAWAAIRRLVGLSVLGWGPWHRCRDRSKENPDCWKEFIVPHEKDWDFPTWKTAAAVYEGFPHSLDHIAEHHLGHI